ncbi:ABC transporter ATP-binding protein [Texcoconibacillus texcoconensis]|uniref:ABC-2 type transport system ATP-binding protein n=1 Tax=Texcoconibacillus texcoconensis TaxID=1095777 RepID=A0A840QPA9_9BACI|nr:ABC transporter ATP-binding protein [Texcoconibacillus texcoconensis]MBB5173232.1 ABC-2 type transport system ATP-binding protein [Texcoconibacillus texcoconensis]
MEEVLKVQTLKGGYQRNKPVLHEVDFSVSSSEIVGLIGLNGAGKSTTIKHILGFMEPFSGNVTIQGRTFLNDPETYRSSYTFIPETPMLYEELTLKEHLELTAMAYGVAEDDYKKRSKKLLKEYRMEKMANWFPSHFSKGMRQKVMIMCAFMVSPPLYVVDEPFVGLDPIGIKSFLDHIVSLKERGAAVLMSTHILATAERYCDRFILLHDGEVVVSGTLADLQAQTGLQGASLDDIYVHVTKEDVR